MKVKYKKPSQEQLIAFEMFVRRGSFTCLQLERGIVKGKTVEQRAREMLVAYQLLHRSGIKFNKKTMMYEP